jgi:hypothetical protein
MQMRIFQDLKPDFWTVTGMNSSQSITIGYGKYYDKLVIPDSSAFAAHVLFSRAWLDSLNTLEYNALSDNKNQF